LTDRKPVPARKLVASEDVTGYLAATYGWADERAARVASIANWVWPGYKAEPTEGGFVMVTRTADPSTTTGAGYLIEDRTGRADG
jgi:hypothetical protein